MVPFLESQFFVDYFVQIYIKSATFIMLYYGDGWVIFSRALPLHLNQCATLTVPLVHTELVPICNKEHFTVGQSVCICAHEGPLCVRAY